MTRRFETLDTQPHDVERALRRLDRDTREPQPLQADDPVFLLSIGWRSGSTLVQRSLMTDPRILVWGEPLGHMTLLGRMIESLPAISDDWPYPDHWLSQRPQVDLVREWVANLAPDPGHLKAAWRAFLDAWLAAPARQRGFTRWGVKEVRWTPAEAVLLRWLYPQAHILVLVRHPLTTYQSLRNFGLLPPAYGFLDRWPDGMVNDAETWGRYWNARALSWSEAASRLGASLLRYEDVVAGRTDLKALGAGLGLALDPDAAAEARVGGALLNETVSPQDAETVLALTESGRRLFDYGA